MERIRAEVILDLLSGRRPVNEQQEREEGPGWAPSVYLSGARITGRLDLRGLSFTPSLLLVDCVFEQPFLMADSMCESVRLYSCELPGFDGTWMASRGDVHLRGCLVNGPVDLTNAYVGGQLVLSGSTIVNPARPAESGEPAVKADGLVVANDMYCRDKAVIEGEFRMVGARIGGELRFTSSTMRNPGRVALRADRITVEKDLYCRDGFRAEGAVRLYGAHIKGQLNLNSATLINPPSQNAANEKATSEKAAGASTTEETASGRNESQGCALDGTQLVVDGHLYCHDDFSAEGEVRLVAARVGGEVRFSASKLSNPGGVALGADRLYVGEDMYCREKLQVEGRVSLRGGHVAGQLNFNNATLRNPGGVALEGTELVVGQHLYCQQGFAAEGEVRLRAARVGGEVRFSASTLSNPGGVALCAERLAVEGDMYCRQNLTVTGEVNLRGAQIGGQLNFNRATLQNQGGTALLADHLVVGTHLYCHDGFCVVGGMSLVAARVGGEVRFSASKLSNPGGVALDADRLAVGADMYCRERLVVEGTIRLRGAHITGQLNFNDATLTDGGEGLALVADQLVVGAHLYCQQGFVAEGRISLVAARVGGEVRFSAARLSHPGDVALDADRLVVSDDMYCRELLQIDGEVRLQGAHIRGDLSFSTALVRNPGAVAIRANRLTVGGHLSCNEGFSAQGLIDLTDAHVNGELSLSKATLASPGGIALLAARLIVDNDMFCRDGFQADGTLCLIGAHVGGRLSFTSALLVGARLTEEQLNAAMITEALTKGGPVLPTVVARKPRGAALVARGGWLARWVSKVVNAGRGATGTPSSGLDVVSGIVNGAHGLALIGDGLRVESDLTCNEGFESVGEIRLRGARIGQNLDFSNASIENGGGFALNTEDLQAERMLMPATCLAGRIRLRNAKMLELDDKRGVRPDQIDLSGLSYETLIPPLDPETRLVWMLRAETFEPQPYEQLARSYRRLGYDDAAHKVHLAKERHRRNTLPYVRRPWGYLQDWTIGYGYRPYRAAFLFALLVLIGVLVFMAFPPPAMNPGAHARLNPFFFSLDLLVPFADFGQRDLWNLTVAQEWFASIFAIVGWTLASTAIAGVTRSLSRA